MQEGEGILGEVASCFRPREESYKVLSTSRKGPLTVLEVVAEGDRESHGQHPAPGKLCPGCGAYLGPLQRQRPPRLVRVSSQSE